MDEPRDGRASRRVAGGEQDYAGHKFGRMPPPSRRRQFEYRGAALAELDRLRATPGAEIVGGIVPVMPKLAAVQDDFGFPLAAGPPRMTP